MRVHILKQSGKQRLYNLRFLCQFEFIVKHSAFYIVYHTQYFFFPLIHPSNNGIHMQNESTNIERRHIFIVPSSDRAPHNKKTPHFFFLQLVCHIFLFLYLPHKSSLFLYRPYVVFPNKIVRLWN